MSLSMIKRFGRKIQVEQYAPGSYVDGFWVPGAKTTKEIIASVQPLNFKDLIRLPENQRNTEMCKIYTLEPLKVADPATKTNSDVIIVDGRRFEVSAQTNWLEQKNGALQYFRFDCVIENRQVGT